jgi:hypothetical protein
MGKQGKIILMVFLFMVLAAVVVVLFINHSRKKKALAINDILDAAEKTPDINTDSTGAPCGGNYKAQTEGATMTDAQATALAKQLVDDIWGLNMTEDTPTWQKYFDLATPDFIMVFRNANQYVKQKGTSWSESATTFKELVTKETAKSIPFSTVRDKIVTRMTSLGLL